MFIQDHNETKIKQNRVQISNESAQGNLVLPELQPHPAKKKLRVFLIFSIITIIALGVFLSFFKSGMFNLNREKTNQSVTTEKDKVAKQDAQSKIPSVDDGKKVLQRKSKLTFPAIISQEQISTELLPDSLKIFISDSAKNLTVFKLGYSGAASGFKFNYKVDNIDTFENESMLMQAASKNEWQRLIGIRTDQVFMLDLQNKKFQLEINGKVSEGNIMEVEGMAIVR